MSSLAGGGSLALFDVDGKRAVRLMNFSDDGFRSSGRDRARQYMVDGMNFIDWFGDPMAAMEDEPAA